MGRARRIAAAESRLIARRVIWTDEARVNLAAIRAYIGQFSPLAAQRIAARLVDTAETLAEHPDRGRQVSKERRELTVIRPYVIRYRTTADNVFILRIRHGARASG
ncbi:MAG: type II toxin-antitoxin system RelE/ParE family toxin [Caulobacteraceae bacterium]